MEQRSLAISYVPGPAPSGAVGPDLTRATWDELYRVATALTDLDRPVSVSALAAESLEVGTNPAFERIFDDATTVEWSRPMATFDPTTGVYSVPQEGLYQVLCKVSADPFPTPAVKSYRVELRTTKRPITGGADVVSTTAGGGLDDSIVTAIAMGLFPCLAGDQFWFDARAVHQTKTGTVNANCNLQFIRVSGVK